MTIEEIRNGAPREATHYDFNDNDDWWNLFSGDFKYYEENCKPL